MALYSKADFARFIGKKNNYVGVLIKRHKIICNKNGLIDDTSEINKGWIDKYKDKNNLVVGSDGNLTPADGEVITPEKTETKAAVISIAKSPPATANKQQPAKQLTTSDQLSYTQLEREKLQRDIEKRDEEIRLLRLRAEKIEGSVIPVELVKNLIAQFAQAMSTAYETTMSNALIEIANKTKMSSKDQAHYKGKIIEQINNSNAEAVKIAKSSLQKLVDEHTEQRGKGERK